MGTRIVKICGVCKIEKPYIEFHKNKRANGYGDGYVCACKECRKERSRKDYEKRKEHIKKKVMEYFHANKPEILEHRKQYQKERLKSDPLFKSIRNLRNRLYYALKNKGWKKNTNFDKYIGLDSYSDLISYLESKFQEGMTWDNYGTYWEIDHIIPLAPAATQEELIKLCHYTNLQPLTIKENRIKRDK